MTPLKPLPFAYDCALIQMGDSNRQDAARHATTRHRVPAGGRARS
jgi:hypothetical protein